MLVIPDKHELLRQKKMRPEIAKRGQNAEYGEKSEEKIIMMTVLDSAGSNRTWIDGST